MQNRKSCADEYLRITLGYRWTRKVRSWEKALVWIGSGMEAI